MSHLPSGLPPRRHGDPPPPPARRRSLRPPALRRDLVTVFLEVSAWSVMVGLGEIALTPMALALGVSEAFSGLIFSVPFLAGAAAQLLVPRLTERWGSFRPVVVATVSLQALALLCLVPACLHGGLPGPVLFLILAAYWAGGLASGPPWISWMDVLVPGRIRARYFALRSRLSKTVVGGGLLLGGWVLQRFHEAGARLQGFALLMLVAGLARLISAALVARQSDVPAEPGEHRAVDLWVLFSLRQKRRDGTLLLYLLVFSGAAQVSAAFFPALMLEQRGLGYQSWSGLVALPLLVNICVLPWLGRQASRRGASWILAGGAVCLAPLPALWLLPWGYPWFLLVAALSGLAQAAHDLGAFLLYYEAIRRQERTSVMSGFQAMLALGLVAGAALGAGLLRALGEGWAAYRVVFLLSATLQVLALFLLRRFLRGSWPS